tara:strand:- start:9234 stop:10091 length:858 start_codon:yes stop_codon:yes gene_type:complete
MTPGQKFRQAVADNHPLQIFGTINAYHARLAQRSGAKAIYVSGGGVAAGSLGLPDLGVITLDDVLTDVKRITRVCDLPLLVDVDTGFDIPVMIKSLIEAGAAACQIEDQVPAKRCGHRPNKSLVLPEQMMARIEHCVTARGDNDFVIVARTDAIANEGMDAAIERMQAYVAAGADMIFAEAVTELAEYKQICAAINVPVLANITEFGKTPLFTTQELADVGVAMVLYPLSAFRAMNKAALNVYQTMIKDGTQKDILDTMQTREELYDYLDYHQFEAALDQMQGKD